MNLKLLEKLFLNNNLKSYLNYKQYFEQQNHNKIKIFNPNKNKEIKKVYDTNKINNILNRKYFNESKNNKINQTKENNNNEYNDSLLNTHQDFIIINQTEEFEKGIPILKLKQKKFEKNISYDRKDLDDKSMFKNLKKFKPENNLNNKNNFINKSINYNNRKYFNYIKDFNNNNKYKKKQLNITNLKRKEHKNILEINNLIPNIEGDKEDQKYQNYEMNDFLKKYYFKKFK